jgi:hypothetical protein
MLAISTSNNNHRHLSACVGLRPSRVLKVAQMSRQRFLALAQSLFLFNSLRPAQTGTPSSRPGERTGEDWEPGTFAGGIYIDSLWPHFLCAFVLAGAKSVPLSKSGRCSSNHWLRGRCFFFFFSLIMVGRGSNRLRSRARAICRKPGYLHLAAQSSGCGPACRVVSEARTGDCPHIRICQVNCGHSAIRRVEVMAHW